MDPQTVFADALARARQIAAKIGSGGGEKRPYSPHSEDDDDFPDAKKMAGNDTMNPQMRSSAAAIAAANAAAQINAKLGLVGSGSVPVNPMAGYSSMGGSLGFSTTEIVEVPDKMVGLVIGKGGEHISIIQNGSGVKVQFAPDSGGMPNRQCTLTGTKEGIVKAKQMIQDILSRGHALPPTDSFKSNGGGGGGGGGFGGMGGGTVEMSVPGPRVGLVIGKNGEMIKHIQERCGVKIVIVQDSNRPSDEDKPLRITGDPDKCQRAKEMVMDLLAQKDGEGGFSGGGGGEYGAARRGGGGSIEIPVPRTMVGVVIGRNGEVIKRISADTGAKVQFKPDEGTGPERQCSISGPPEGVQRAAQIVRELVQNAARPDGGRANGGGPYGGGGQDSTFAVPAEKCGLVIGKGGETIREINSRSGARVELSRNESQASPQRTFNIKGSPDQIQEAIRLICEKAGLPPPGGPQGGYGGGPGGPYGGSGPQYGYPGGMPHGGPMGYPNPGGWAGPYQGQQPQPPWASSANDPAKASQSQAGQDPMAAWAAYYQSMYPHMQQPGQPPAPGQQQNPYGAAQQQSQQAPQQPQAGQQQAAGGQQGFSYSAPSVNPQTGQMDYSAAWAEYYRQQGMYQQAQAITQAGGADQQPQPPQSR